MDQQFLALYDRHVGSAFDRQRRFAGYLERKAPGVKPELHSDTATLTVGPRLKFEAELLGAHVFGNRSWVWAWTNRHAKLTLTNRALGDAVRAVAHRLGLHALTAPGFPLIPLLGDELAPNAAHVIGTVLAAELSFDAYFVAPYDGGEAVALIRDERLRVSEKNPLRRIVTLFPQAVAEMPPFDHRAALRGYADDYAIKVTDEPGGLRLAAGKDHLLATFDVHDRLTRLDGTVSPEQTVKKTVAAKKPSLKAVAKATKKPAAKPAAAEKASKPVTKPVSKPTAKKAAAAKKKSPPKPAKKR